MQRLTAVGISSTAFNLSHKHNLLTALKHAQKTEGSLCAASCSTLGDLSNSNFFSRHKCRGSEASQHSVAALHQPDRCTFSAHQYRLAALPDTACSSVSLRIFVSAAMHDRSTQRSAALSQKEASLIQLFLAASLHLWEQLPGDDLRRLHAT